MFNISKPRSLRAGFAVPRKVSLQTGKLVAIVVAISALWSCYPAPQAAQKQLIRAPILPGRLVGGINQISDPKNKSFDLIASYYGLPTSRVSKLSTGKLKVDQRWIEPQFYNWISGIVLNVPEAQVYLVNKGKVIKSYPAGVSRSSWQVPLGRTKVVSMKKNPTWYVPESIQQEMARKGLEVKTKVPPGSDNPLGTRWIGFSNNKYGFHGTNDPASIKNYESHGCVRLFKSHIEHLYDQVAVGTPVHIYYQPIKLAVQDDHIWMASYPDIYNLYPKRKDPRAIVRELATKEGVLDRIDWKQVEQQIQKQNGAIADVALKPARKK